MFLSTKVLGQRALLSTWRRFRGLHGQSVLWHLKEELLTVLVLEETDEGLKIHVFTTFSKFKLLRFLKLVLVTLTELLRLQTAGTVI